MLNTANACAEMRDEELALIPTMKVPSNAAAKNTYNILEAVIHQRQKQKANTKEGSEKLLKD